MALSAPPIRTPFKGEKQDVHWSWISWFQQHTVQTNHPASVSTAPAASNATADGGEIAFDANFLYVAVGKNRWKRIPLNAF